MDPKRFDALARALGGSANRRSLLGLLAGMAAGPRTVSAGSRGKSEGSAWPAARCIDGSAGSKRCTEQDDCCTGLCIEGICRCKPNQLACRQDGECCSKLCIKGRCDGGCKPQGGRCITTDNCCSGMTCELGRCLPSPEPSCGPGTCNGCCAGTNCRVGLDGSACGLGGVACVECARGQVCGGDGMCFTPPSCTRQTCPHGCCQNDVCIRYSEQSDDTCGGGGLKCFRCRGNEKCRLGSCMSPDCDSSTCPKGCCQGNQCIYRRKQNSGACGTDGERCVRCRTGQDCENGKCVKASAACTPATCPDGCCKGAKCVRVPKQDGNKCGINGAACAVCPSGQSCSAGICSGGGGGGGGGCTSNSQCTGSTDTCTGGVCTGSTDTCTGGFCGCGSGAACAGATAFCVTGGCVACVADGNCAGSTPYCVANVCSAPVWKNKATIGTDGSGPSNLNYPTDVVVSADMLTMYIADYGNSRVSVWTRPDTSTAWANQTTFGSTSGSGISEMASPYNIAVSPDGLTVWVSDEAYKRVVVWTRPNNTSTSWTAQTSFGTDGSGVGNLDYQHGVKASADGLTVWVADTGNSRVSIWTRPNNTSTTWTNVTTFGSWGLQPGGLYNPYGLWVSPDTLTCVVTLDDSRISIWTRPDATSTDWTYETEFGTNGSESDQLYSPKGAYVSASGLTMWVADTKNNRISIWARPDIASTSWGNVTTFGTQGSGTGNLDNPYAVWPSPDGNTLWIADEVNNRIAVWTAERPT